MSEIIVLSRRLWMHQPAVSCDMLRNKDRPFLLLLGPVLSLSGADCVLFHQDNLFFRGRASVSSCRP